MYGVRGRGCGVWGAGYRMWGTGCRVWDTGCGGGARDAGAGCGCGPCFGGCDVGRRADVGTPRPRLQLPSALTAGSGCAFLLFQAPPPRGLHLPPFPRTGSGRPRGGGASAAGREEERAELRWRRRRCWSSSARSPCCPPTARRPSASCTPSVRPGAPRDPSAGARPIPAPSVPRHGRLLTHGAARPAWLGAAGSGMAGMGGGLGFAAPRGVGL